MVQWLRFVLAMHTCWFLPLVAIQSTSGVSGSTSDKSLTSKTGKLGGLYWELVMGVHI